MIWCPPVVQPSFRWKAAAPPTKGPMTWGPQSRSRANLGRATVTKEGHEGLDLPPQSNFINVALKSISRKETAQLTANSHVLFPSCMNSLCQGTEADTSSRDRLPCRRFPLILREPRSEGKGSRHLSGYLGITKA